MYEALNVREHGPGQWLAMCTGFMYEALNGREHGPSQWLAMCTGFFRKP